MYLGIYTSDHEIFFLEEHLITSTAPPYWSHVGFMLPTSVPIYTDSTTRSLQHTIFRRGRGVQAFRSSKPNLP